MRAQISCDEVFDILTRGPFPSGDPRDGAVEMHLIACHECRRLAEALRPAVELFHESVPSSELRHLPGYRGALCETPILDATQGRSTCATSTATARASRVWRNLCAHDVSLPRFAAALSLATGLCFLLWAVGWSDPQSPSESGATKAAVKRPVASANLAHSLTDLLGATKLSADCLKRPDTTPELVGPEPTLRNSSADQLCCTFCHAVNGSARISPDSLAAVARSCQACHIE